MTEYYKHEMEQAVIAALGLEGQQWVQRIVLTMDTDHIPKLTVESTIENDKWEALTRVLTEYIPHFEKGATETEELDGRVIASRCGNCGQIEYVTT